MSEYYESLKINYEIRNPSWKLHVGSVFSGRPEEEELGDKMNSGFTEDV